jgi:hypothetical protein
VSLQHRHRVGVDGDLAFPPGLGRLDPRTAGGGVDSEQSLVGVDAGPSDGHQLATAHAGDRAEGEQGSDVGHHLDGGFEQLAELLDLRWCVLARHVGARRELEVGHWAARDHAAPLGPPEERCVQAAGVVHAGSAQPGPPHPPEDPIDGGLVDVTDPAPADLRGEPLQVEAPVVLDRARVAALLAEEVLSQEQFDRLVDSHVAVAAMLRERSLAYLRDEPGKLASRLRLGVRPHSAMQATNAAVGKAAGGDGELPHARPDFHLGARAARRPLPPVDHRGVSTEGEVLDSHARWVVGARVDRDSRGERPPLQFPRDAPSRDGPAVDLELSGPVGRSGAGPPVVLPRAVDLGFEAGPQLLVHRSSPRSRCKREV